MAVIHESDLIERFKNEDPSAFAAIVHGYQDRIYNLCRYMLQDHQDAQDAAQDTFLKAYRGLSRFNPESSLYTWLYRITVNTCLDYRRKSRRKRIKSEPLTEDLPSYEQSPHQLYESRQATESIQAALQKLPENLNIVQKYCKFT
jgi:RNA polymerase sigma-70 factor, ECF subfamily